MPVTLHAAEVVGIEGEIIDVEIDLSPGLHSFSIVGLADKAVEESRDRIAAAIKNAGARAPQKKNHRITVSLAPADLKKEGPAFDFPIALAYMLASGQAKFSPDGRVFLGELALDGALRRIKGVLALALTAAARGFRELYVPEGNGTEASLAHGITIYEVASLQEALEHLEGKHLLPATPPWDIKHVPEGEGLYDFADVAGQESAKRGLEIAAAGNHNILLSGPPGAGKTLLSRALPSILPAPNREEIIEITKIHSIAGTLPRQEGALPTRPFRSPHHTASHIALVGGGVWPRPGEITLAHRGVLFLDEFPEFERRVIEALRQPLEDGVVTVSRARGSITFPAKIMLVAAMNPCPCGNYGNPRRECVCPPRALERYARKISGPIVDRLDMWVDVHAVEHAKLASHQTAERSAAIRHRVEGARALQRVRYAGTRFMVNSEIGPKEIKTYCALDVPSAALLERAARELDLSARAYHRVIKIARTIADLASSPAITADHILEALQYRPKQRNPLTL